MRGRPQRNDTDACHVTHFSLSKIQNAVKLSSVFGDLKKGCVHRCLDKDYLWHIFVNDLFIFRFLSNFQTWTSAIVLPKIIFINVCMCYKHFVIYRTDFLVVRFGLSWYPSNRHVQNSHALNKRIKFSSLQFALFLNILYVTACQLSVQPKSIPNV